MDFQDTVRAPDDADHRFRAMPITCQAGVKQDGFLA
jgi:hypothetical protein